MAREIFASVIDPDTGGTGWAGADIDEVTGEVEVILNSMLSQPWYVEVELPGGQKKSFIVPPKQTRTITSSAESWVRSKTTEGIREFDVRSVRSTYPALESHEENV